MILIIKPNLLCLTITWVILTVPLVIFPREGLIVLIMTIILRFPIKKLILSFPIKKLILKKLKRNKIILKERLLDQQQA